MTNKFDAQLLPDSACCRLELRVLRQEQGIEKPLRRHRGVVGEPADAFPQRTIDSYIIHTPSTLSRGKCMLVSSSRLCLPQGSSGLRGQNVYFPFRTSIDVVSKHCFCFYLTFNPATGMRSLVTGLAAPWAGRLSRSDR